MVKTLYSILHRSLDLTDMYTSCTLSELDGVITDNEISNELKKYYSKFANIITKERSEYNDNYSNI